MRRFVIGFYILWSLLESQASYAASVKELTMASLDWPPYVSSELKNQGYVTVLVKKIFQEAGYDVKLTFMPWTRVLNDVERGKIDIVASAYPNPERDRKFYISKPYTRAVLGFFKMKNKTINYTKIDDLKPYIIGVGRGYAHTPEFDSADYLKKEEVEKVEQNFLKLIAGRIHLAAGDRANGYFVLSKLLAETTDPKKKEALGEIEFVSPPLIDFTLHVLVSRKIPNAKTYVKNFDEALARLIARGEIPAVK